jgi:hypothetical protein
MNAILWASFAGIVLWFCWAVFAGCRSWPALHPKRRIAGILLLTPHLLLIVCLGVSIVLSLRCGTAAQGSRCFNAQFASDVYAVFILPVPALIGTSIALVLFRKVRRREFPDHGSKPARE